MSKRKYYAFTENSEIITKDEEIFRTLVTDENRDCFFLCKISNSLLKRDEKRRTSQMPNLVDPYGNSAPISWRRGDQQVNK